MKNKFFLLFIGLFLFLGAIDVQAGDREAILNFTSEIFVQADNSITVEETIVYDTGPQERHGIYRDIFLYSSSNFKMKIGNIEVTDAFQYLCILSNPAQKPSLISSLVIPPNIVSYALAIAG